MRVIKRNLYSLMCVCVCDDIFYVFNIYLD